jgi:hypothetical protein
MQLRLRVAFWLVRPEDLKVLYGLRQRSALRADNGKSDWQMSRAGFHGTKTDWEGDPRKNKARRLVASGQRLMRGGYRTLLHYPIKLPRR